jgi:hypothetical protein
LSQYSPTESLILSGLLSKSRQAYVDPIQVKLKSFETKMQRGAQRSLDFRHHILEQRRSLQISRQPDEPPRISVVKHIEKEHIEKSLRSYLEKRVKYDKQRVSL